MIHINEADSIIHILGSSGNMIALASLHLCIGHEESIGQHALKQNLCN